MSVGSNNKKPDSEANNDNDNNNTDNSAKTNGETTKKQNGTIIESTDDSTDAAGPEAAPRISRRRRRRVRPSHRTWDSEIMPEGKLTGLFDSDISDQEDETPEETPEGTPAKTLQGPEDWVTAKLPDEDLESMPDNSPSRLEWLRQKKEDGQTNEHLDSLMSMVGLEPIKAHFLQIKQRVEAAKRWGDEMKTVKLDLIMSGREGTGKKRIAQLYAEFLNSIGAVSRRDFMKVTSSSEMDWEKTDGPVVLYYESGKVLCDYHQMNTVLEYKDKVDGGAVIIAPFRDFDDAAKSHLESTPESRRRIPEPIKIDNYTADETSQLLTRLMTLKPEFSDEASADLITRILTQRIQRQRSQDEDNFTNMVCMSDELDKVCERYWKRVDSEWAEWSEKNSPAEGSSFDEQKPKKGGVSIDDVLGPRAADVRSTSKAWKEIQQLVGLHQVKREIGYLFDLAEYNQEREREGKDATPIALNRCFFGSPGVGKTTVVALYAQILSDLGLLSKGHVTTKTPDDLIGKYIGHTEDNVLTALTDAKGGILIIDDAHMLYNGAGRANSCSDVFRIAAIDTLVANISGSPGEDRCVILSGYEDNMEQMFLNSNPGLQRRFPMENALRFANYTQDELCQILDLKMKADGLSSSDDGRKVAREVLGRMRSRPKFGNGGDVVSFLSRAKLRMVDRLKSSGSSTIFDLGASQLEPRDFDPDFDRALRADQNRADIFRGMVGFEDIVEQFRRYQKMADGMRRHAVDPRPHIPWAFVFKGPPGTGKTSTARKIGQLFYDMGFLSSSDVHTCSVTDIIGEYVGQTGPKVINQFERGLGRVLFIDEAYRLAGGGSCDKYAADAVGEIVDAMTKPRYMGNMVVILGGYGDEMEKLLQTNPGLRSRFPTHIEFRNMTADLSLQHLTQTLSKMGISVAGKDVPTRDNVLAAFKQLALTKGWANGRDVETLAKRIIGHVFVQAGESLGESEPGELTVSHEDLQRFCVEMLQERGGHFKPQLRAGREPLGAKEWLGSIPLQKNAPLTNGYKVF